VAVVSPAQTSFNAGEVSERIWSRWDQNIRSIAVKSMLGWLPLLQGPAEACPGTLFVAACKGPSRPIPYEFNPTQGYIAELGQNYARFFTNDVRIETSPGVAYEIATPWTYDQAQALAYHQELDVMYCTVRSVPTQRLYRTSADTFAIAAQPINNGPFEPRNTNESLTITPSATTGSGITITASAALFEAGDVGGIMEIGGGSFGSIPAWEAGMEIGAGSLCQSNGNVYQQVSGTRTGQVAPTHTEGSEYDGMLGTDVNTKGPYGVLWQYLYGRWGQVKFTGYTSATVMTADVVTRLASTAATWRWRMGAFSTRRGFADVACVWQERLVLFKDGSGHASVSGDLDDFSLRNELGDPSRDMAFSFDLPGRPDVYWAVADQMLVIGTSKGVFVLAQASQGAGAGPGNTDTGRPPKSARAARARPELIDNRVVFVGAARDRLIQLPYDVSKMLAAESANLNRFADHIAAEHGFAETAWCEAPERLLWARKDDGTLAVCAYDPDEQLLGWARRELGGGLAARGIATITDPDGRFPQLWMTAQLGDDWHMLRMAPIRRTGDTSEQVMLDSAVRMAGGMSIVVPHLAGRSVDILADGRPIMAATLDGDGEYAMPFIASDVIVGLRYPDELRLLPPVGGSDNGPGYGKLKRASRIDLAMINTDTVEVECQGAIETVNLLKVASSLDTYTPLASGRHRIEPRGNVDGDMEIVIRRLYPRPSTVAAVMPYFESAGA
jgi:hypothetical protein